MQTHTHVLAHPPASTNTSADSTSSALLYLASQSPRRQTLLQQIAIPFTLLLAEPSEDVEALEIALPNEDASTYVQRVTQLKALAALARLQRYQQGLSIATLENTSSHPIATPAQKNWPTLPILCADTIVTYQGRLLGKPQNPQEAQHMLHALSGSTHQVLTAVSIALPQTPTLLPSQNASTEHAQIFSVKIPIQPPTDSPKTEKIYTILSTSEVRLSTLTSDEIAAYIASGEPFGKAGAYAIQGRAAKFIESISGSYSGIMGLPLFETATLLRELGIEQ